MSKTNAPTPPGNLKAAKHDIVLTAQYADNIMHALSVCDRYGVGPTVEATRKLVIAIHDQHPKVFHAYEDTLAARDALAHMGGHEAGHA
jgi:hypothetical protein